VIAEGIAAFQSDSLALFFFFCPRAAPNLETAQQWSGKMFEGQETRQTVS
jgi:hypothetical protein